MGGASVKKIQDTLEQKYKPVRKYYDDFYGQITVIQDRETNKTRAKCEKILFPNKTTLEYISSRLKNSHELLVGIRLAERVPVDMCSGNEICVFVMDYYGGTLYQEITRRSRQEKLFAFGELLQIFYAVMQAMKLLSQVQSKNRVLYSNSSFLYVSEGQIKVLQSIFCNKNDNVQTQFQLIYSHDQSQFREYYISPQSYSLLLRKQKFKAKEVAMEESSIVFTLGMNFLECILLADLSQMYDRANKVFDYGKLKEALSNILQFYEDDLEKLIGSMTQECASKRPSLQEVEEYLKYLMQSNQVRPKEYASYLGKTGVQ